MHDKDGMVFWSQLMATAAQADDGFGFDPNAEVGIEHLGLFGIRERVEMINGKLMFESSPGKGTTLMVEVNHADTLVSHG
jgi:nitrate/nitrite-specific signal transduction histidine kinase